MLFSANLPALTVDREKLRRRGIDDDLLRQYLPEYLLNPEVLKYGPVKHWGLLMLRLFFAALVKLFLSPRASSGSLGREEVDEVYTREARTYDRKHHITTRGMDLVWRRAAGWFIAAIARRTKGHLSVLDLCTGTGLTVKEMLGILREWGIEAEVIGLDFNERMLAVARKGDAARSDHVRFVRGDAMALADGFAPDSVGAVTQVFGIGGIPEPMKVFSGVLRILKPGGRFLMTDMHKPIPQFPGEWPLFLKWLRFPLIEAALYEQITLPLVLKRLWGWRDTTPCFYLLPLVTYRDGAGKYWGFEVRSLEQESQRWWFALPLMPVARIVVEKVEIAEDIAMERQAIIAACATP